jgi:ferredoxin
LTETIQDTARRLLTGKDVSCVIGYENGTYGRVRPVFIYSPDDVDRLIWNPQCSHNLTVYLKHKLETGHGRSHVQSEGDHKPVAVVVKPCDSKAINVMLTENQFSRDQVHLIGVVCDGIQIEQNSPELQSRCQTCQDLSPVVYDTLIGEAPKTRTNGKAWQDDALEYLQNMAPAERVEFWLSQFDRCIRCYACRQACPMCDCPTCLFERDDSLWTGIGIGINEKRAFHLGRAYHLAGRCIGCNECERVCPMEIPISLLNMHLAQEIQATFNHRAGMEAVPSPFVTVLDREEV